MAIKKFIISFLAGMAIFLVVNLAYDFYNSDGIDDPGSVMREGFPFVYRAHPDYPDLYFSWVDLLADIGIAVVVSASVAMVFLVEPVNPFSTSSIGQQGLRT